MIRLPAIIIFFICIISVLANPAPVSIELYDFILIALTCLLGLIGLVNIKKYVIQKEDSILLLSISWYLSYLLLSILIGLLHNVPTLNVLRSIGPYISFFPILLIGFLPEKFLSRRSIAYSFISAGLLQASYLLYLYLTHASHASNTFDVLRNRITQHDPRTTLPLLLASAILPIYFFFQQAITLRIRIMRDSIASALLLLSLFAGIMTLTRAIILAMFFGWIIFGILYFLKHINNKNFHWSPVIKKCLIYLFLFSLIFIFLSCIPKIHMLETGLFARFHSASALGNTDYSDGRLYDEWGPALVTWKQSGIFGIVFGIGAGNSFTVLSGEERTYIHNLCIYSLVYGGFFGLFSCLFLYFTLFKTLLFRAKQTNDVIYLLFATLLASLFFYGQLFAVHKGLAFNSMLFILIAIALIHPICKSPPLHSSGE